MKFERSMMILAVLATLAFVAAGLSSYRLDLPFAGLEPHLLFGAGTLSALLLPHFWVVFYLRATAKALRAVGAPEVSHRRLFLLIAVTVASLLALVACGVVALSGPWAQRLHHGLFFVAVVLQAVTLVAEWQRLRENADRLRSADAPA